MKNIARSAIFCFISIVFTANVKAQTFWNQYYDAPNTLQSCVKDTSGYYFYAGPLYPNGKDTTDIQEISQRGSLISGYIVPLKNASIEMAFNAKNNTIYLIEMGDSNITLQSLNPVTKTITDFTSFKTLPGIVTVKGAITDSAGTLYICGNTINTDTTPYAQNGFLYKIDLDKNVTQAHFNDDVIDVYNLAFSTMDTLYMNSQVYHTSKPDSGYGTALFKLTPAMQTVWEDNLYQNGGGDMIYDLGSVTLSSNENLTTVSSAKTTTWDSSFPNVNTVFTALCDSQILAVHNSNAIFGDDSITLMVYDYKRNLVNTFNLIQNFSNYVQYVDIDNEGNIVLIGTVLDSTGNYRGMFAEGILQDSVYACSSSTGLPPSINTQPQISAYPNPAYDNITINFQNPNPTASLLIYNVIGQQVMSREITTNTTSIPTTSLSNGLYLIRVIDSEGNSYVVKEVVKNY